MSATPLYLHEWPEKLATVNADAAPTLVELLGNVVLLYFWSGSVSHSQGLLADIKSLTTRFPEGLSVIGVHVPRFPAEVSDAAVLKHVNRSFIRHHTLNDPEHRLFRRFGLDTWPSVVLLDAQGQLSDIYAGENRLAELETQINQLLNRARRDRLLVASTPAPVRVAEPTSTLSFPGAMVASANRLFLCDSGRNRVLECTFDGVIVRQFGSGNAGFWDGVANESGFQLPQALALHEHTLYVADTGNQVVRAVNLISGEVSTIMGTGRYGRAATITGLGGLEVPLAQPLGVAATANRVYVAVSAMHQIFALGTGELDTSALFGPTGSARAGSEDGFGELASFVEPQAMATSADSLFVLDSSAGALRSMRLSDGIVSTLIAGDVAQFGDKDGPSGTAQLQYPRALCFDPKRNVVWIADSYNAKIKVYSLVKREVKTLSLNYPLRNPGGLALGGDALFIANTDAHELLKLDLKTGRLARVAISEGNP